MSWNLTFSTCLIFIGIFRLTHSTGDNTTINPTNVAKSVNNDATKVTINNIIPTKPPCQLFTPGVFTKTFVDLVEYTIGKINC
ncbi:unnamed protein product [Leptidea sinapis]|uniref:Uncharacterized protein n=1 Tax=Leptidea sinapis TaxID=189913 RepID=A0A5E4QXC0_9NEOP|nr:unnamed protein product [Leptidea sinapis]